MWIFLMTFKKNTHSSDTIEHWTKQTSRIAECKRKTRRTKIQIYVAQHLYCNYRGKNSKSANRITSEKKNRRWITFNKCLMNMDYTIPHTWVWNGYLFTRFSLFKPASFSSKSVKKMPGKFVIMCYVIWWTIS